MDGPEGGKENFSNKIRGRSSTLSSLDYEKDYSAPGVLKAPISRSPNNNITGKVDQVPHDSVHSTPAFSAPQAFPIDLSRFDVQRPSSAREAKRKDWGSETGSPAKTRESPRSALDEDNAGHFGADRVPGLPSFTPKSVYRQSNVPRRESTTLSSSLASLELDHAELQRARTYESQPSHSSRSISDVDQPGKYSSTVLPPSAIAASSVEQSPQTPAMPASVLKSLGRSQSESYKQGSPRSHTARSTKGDMSPSSRRASAPDFEKALFRNAAILCDVRGTLVEYAQKIPDEVDPRWDTEMVEGCKECRICVIKKRENRPHGGTRLATSIWAISDDGSIRCQQKLSDIVETVPYCSYFEQEKVSIPPTGGEEIKLVFHGESWGDEPDNETKTNWVNFILASETDAQAFQSAVFNRTLIGSFRITKTTVIHDGIRGTFAFEEQFAGIEMLRLWEDDGVATPGGEGGVLALMHISSNFGDGWARWWTNCSRQQVRVKGDGSKHAKLRGIEIDVVKPGQIVSAGDKLRNKVTMGDLQRFDTESLPKSAGKKVPVTRVTGIRIEFKTEEERNEFLDMSKRAQSRMIPLPTL